MAGAVSPQEDPSHGHSLLSLREPDVGRVRAGAVHAIVAASGGNPALPRIAARIAAALPSADIATVPGLPRFAMSTEPEAFVAAALDHLERGVPERTRHRQPGLTRRCGRGRLQRRCEYPNDSEERLQALGVYLNFLLPIADGDNWAGPDMVANWYRRNFKVAANIHAIAGPDDQLLVIYGGGHIPVLEHALSLGTTFRVHDVLRNLPGA